MCWVLFCFVALHWRHNERNGVSNHQPHDCLLNRLFMRKSKETSKLRVTGLCAGNSPVTTEFPAQRASDPENVPIWWRHRSIEDFRGIFTHIFQSCFFGIEAIPSASVSNIYCLCVNCVMEKHFPTVILWTRYIYIYIFHDYIFNWAKIIMMSLLHFTIKRRKSDDDVLAFCMTTRRRLFIYEITMT